MQGYPRYYRYRLYNIEQFAIYTDYTKALAFQQDPDYEYLISLFKEMITNFCSALDYDFDWNGKLKSSTTVDLENNKQHKVNTSLALNNNNISRNSNVNEDSNIYPDGEINNSVIFKREEL